MSTRSSNNIPPALGGISGREIRALRGADLSESGIESLRLHLVSSAMRAHVKHQAIQGNSLYTFLSDPEFVRYPVHLAYEIGTMAPHQFAQPELNPDSVTPSYILYLHPLLGDRALATRMAIAYFIPIINFGKVVTEDLAFLFGATLLGIPELDFYEALCGLADSIGATACLSGKTRNIV